ncbi:DUF1569 domain-containing protein [Flavobacterium jejuense]|uniref:DUF1569 domain-containing protein n=1 Tax=Flavobacterium jejuense TaxID=1544455 RepID=A0ABX0IYJ8_9FLAO|nr:DUF1569 domain-containing protein [Flavobacterium jejuense]NHN27919.1 DUF1569 domain-containing protein [Flavobacterium jejuense]
MKNIFDPKDNQEIIKRIHNLTPESKPLWGKMSVDQMLSHCISPIAVALGIETLKISFPMRMLGRMMKKSWLDAPEFKKNSPTAKEFIRKETYDFELTKNQLIERIQKLGEGFQVVQLEVHPFWGKLNEADWNNLQWKHLDHHLRQFGV